MKQESKEITFSRSEKTVKGVCILADDEMGEEADFFVRFGKTIVGGDGNEDFVADALAVDDGPGGPGFGKGAFEEGDHRFTRLPKWSARKRRSVGGG